MRIDEIGEEVFLVSECDPPPWKEGEGPPWNDAVCREIAGRGIDSLMVLAESQTPFMVRTEGYLWCVIKPLADPDAPLPAELVGIADFVPYERARGRTVGFWIGYESAMDKLVDTIRAATPVHPEERPMPDSPLCCRPYRSGCSGALLCHGTSVDVAQAILQSGRLKSKVLLSGMLQQELVEYAKRENVGDPPDYYQYVMLGNGNCIAPDLVVAARRANRFVFRDEVETNFYPGARFFFRTREMFEHPQATFDGLHPVKIKDALKLNSYLVAVVVPQVDEDGSHLVIKSPPEFADRVIQLDHREHYGLRQWSDAVFEAARECMSSETDPGDGSVAIP